MDEMLKLSLDNIRLELSMQREDNRLREKRFEALVDQVRHENENLRVGLELLKARIQQLEQAGRA